MLLKQMGEERLGPSFEGRGLEGRITASRIQI